MKSDPRDKYYYSLQRKDIDQLTQEELKAYLSYCDKMLEQVEKKGRKGWHKLKTEIAERLNNPQ